MFSTMLTTDTNEWLVITTVLVLCCLFVGLIVWAMVLEIRYISPFTLIRTSNHDKWRKALILSLLQTAIIPILGFASPILSPLSDQLLLIPICGSVWIVILLIATLYKRWGFERHIKNYQRLDKMIKEKNNIYRRLSFLTSWTRLFMTADQRRFFTEGFPEHFGEKKESDSTNQKLRSES